MVQDEENEISEEGQEYQPWYRDPENSHPFDLVRRFKVSLSCTIKNIETLHYTLIVSKGRCTYLPESGHISMEERLPRHSVERSTQHRGLYC